MKRKHLVTTLALTMVTPVMAETIFTSQSSFEAVAGQSTAFIDLLAGALPQGSTLVSGEVMSPYVASTTFINQVRVYTLRGGAWSDEFSIGSGNAVGQTGGGTYYQAHRWSGSGTALSADPQGGSFLTFALNRPEAPVGIHTTAGFFGYLPDTTNGLLVLPQNALITRFDMNYVASPVPETSSVAMMLAGMALLSAFARRRRT